MAPVPLPTPKTDVVTIAAEFLPGAPHLLTLQVNALTGAATILGDTTRNISVNYYQITSAGHSLDAVNWASLADQDFDGNGPPSGSGNGWEEAGGAGSRCPGRSLSAGQQHHRRGRVGRPGKGLRRHRGRARTWRSPTGPTPGDRSMDSSHTSPVPTAWTNAAGNKKWNDSGNWDNYIPDAEGAVARFGTAAAEVIVDTKDVTVGTMRVHREQLLQRQRHRQHHHADHGRQCADRPASERRHAHRLASRWSLPAARISTVRAR